MNKEDSPSFHLIISRIKEDTWLKVSDEIRRHELIGILMDIVFMLQSSNAIFVRPEDCKLRAYVIIDDEQPELNE